MYTLLYTSVSEVCLPFYIPKALKRYPFQGEPPHIGHPKDLFPPLVLGEQRQKLSLNCSDFLGELLVVCSTRRFIVGCILNTNAKLLRKSQDCCNRFQHSSHRINVTGWTVLPVLCDFWSKVTFPMVTVLMHLLLVHGDHGTSLMKHHIIAFNVVVQKSFRMQCSKAEQIFTNK